MHSRPDQVITAWTAMDEENGCLRYIDGAHLAGILPHHSLDVEHNLDLPRPSWWI